MYKIINHLAFLSLILCAQTTIAEVDEQSIFYSARHPASNLDLRLLDVQNAWRLHYIAAPNTKTKKEHPLIVQAGLSIRIYYNGNDIISVNGHITNIGGFLKFSPSQRKKLISDTLNQLVSIFNAEILVNKETGLHIKRKIQKNNFVIGVRLDNITRDDKNNIVPAFPPLDIGYGQAGYKDGKFIYSEDYYLKLKVKNGIAVSGNTDKYIIESK